ncbi:SGNH/GDSL hydrolase family protein [Kribbella antiqua]|uniref:SGNH/GDSL hydrolase family protein n=1 Tax=Kribbella antiqua TaxID=2512217 RepID=UPI0010516447|nr:SGNH/GDSL hydrolase family protein [Kribbella antiqua]
MRILFVGNSFTARNNLPGLLTGLAGARGIDLEHRLIQAGGASLRQHLNAGKALEAIATGGFDVVVLQEQSTLPIKSPDRFRESARDFDAAIKAAGLRTALYMTWARRNAPETQQALTSAYAGSAAELGATLVPVGVIWERFIKQYDEPVLHDSDNSHPALAGSYLAACVFLMALLEQDPVGIDVPVKGLDADTAALLRQAAWDLTAAE